MGRSSRLRAKARRCTGALPSVRRPRRLTARDLPLTAGSSPPRDWKKTSSRCPRTSGWSPGMCRATSSTRASPRTMPSRFSATGEATTVSAPVACTAQSRCVALSECAVRLNYIPADFECETIRPQVFFPACWDGENAFLEDSAHVAYPLERYEGGPCPSSHPKRIPVPFVEGEGRPALS